MTADEIVDRVRRLSFVASTTQFTDAVVLESINSAMAAMLGPALGRAGGELLTEEYQTSLVAGTATYTLPTRAMLSTSRVVYWLDANGKPRPPLRRAELADIHRYGDAQSSEPVAFTLSAAQITLFPTPNTGGVLVVKYPKRLGVLVMDELNGASQHTKVFTISTVTPVMSGSTWNPLTDYCNVAFSAAHGAIPAGSYVDCTSYKSPYRLIAMDALCNTGVAAGVGSLAVGADLRTAVAGDFVTYSDTSYVPQCPREWHELLLLFAAARVCMERKDYGLRDQHLREATSLERELINAAAPRTKQNAKGVSAWRGMSRYRYRW